MTTLITMACRMVPALHGGIRSVSSRKSWNLQLARTVIIMVRQSAGDRGHRWHIASALAVGGLIAASALAACGGPGRSALPGGASPSSGAAPRAATTSKVVPWSPIPPGVPATTVAPTTTTTTLAPAPPCTASGLRAKSGQGGAAAGNLASPIVVTNVSRSTCRLSGYPDLVGITKSGALHALAATHASMFGPLAPADLRPGKSGRLVIGTTDGCPALNAPPAVAAANSVGHRFDGVEVILSDGHGILRVDHVVFNAACGISETALGVVPAMPSPPAGSLATLTATAHIPKQIRSGREMEYTVTLANPTRTSVELHPCPTYEEALYFYARGGKTDHVTRSYTLDCATVPAITAGASATFAMKIEIPPVTLRTVAKFIWAIDMFTGPAAGGGLVVLPG